MLNAHDFHRAAAYLLDCYGREARIRAANRAKELRTGGESRLYPIWEILAATIDELEKAKPN